MGDTATTPIPDQHKKIIPSNAIITTHYLFNSVPKEFINDDVLKVIHLDCFDNDDQVAQSAMNLLKNIGSEKSFNYLFNIIKDYPDERKIWALDTLYHIGNEKIVQPLLDYFKISFDEVIKSYVLRTLSHIGYQNEEVKKLIISNSSEELNESPTRFTAIQGLSYIQEVDNLKKVVESKNEDIIIAGLQSLGKIKNIDSLHLIKRLSLQFKALSHRIQMALIKSLVELENDYVLELIKIIFQENNDDYIAELIEIIKVSDYFTKYPIRLTKILLRMPETSSKTETLIEDFFAAYYGSFPDVGSKASQEISESIESNLRSYFAKFKVNYQNEYKANLSLKTQIEKDLFYAKEFLEKFADETFVHSISDYLKKETFDPNNASYTKIKNNINETSSRIAGDYNINVKAILNLLQSTDKLERSRVAAHLNTVDFKKKHDINRLHRLLSFVSITKSVKSMDVCHEIFRWGLQLQDRELIETSVIALGRSGHKILIKEADKTLLPMDSKKIRMATITGLGELGHPDGIPVLVNFFSTYVYDEDIYLSIITAFEKINSKNNREVLETLLKIFVKSPSDTVKYKSGMVFAKLSSHSMIPALAKYKDSQVEKIRELLPLMIGKLFENNDGNGKEMVQNFYYSLLKDPSLNVKINAILMLYRMGDAYSIEVLKDLFNTTDFKTLSDIILNTIEMDSLDKIYWLINLLNNENDGIQRSVSISLTSLLEGDSKNKKIIADLIKEFRLKPFANKQIEEIDSIKETQLDLSQAQEKDKYQFERENTKEMTILFIDITGYTKKSSSMELIEIMNYLKTYEEMAIPIFKAHFGTVVKKMGDGLMVSFPLALYASLAGIRLQEKLANYNRFKPDKEKIITRVGINTGNVAIRGNDLFGDAVNVASRMETKARPGGVLVSEATFKQVEEYVTSEDMGLIEVKGKDVPIHSYHIISISASLTDDLDPLISGDSAIKKIPQTVSTQTTQSEIEKIKSLITLSQDAYKHPINKKLIYNYRLLYKAIGDIKDPQMRENIHNLLLNQWHELKPLLPK